MANEANKDNIQNPEGTSKQVKEIVKRVLEISKVVLRWIYRLRSVLLSLPVAIAAVWLAVRNSDRLPGPLEIGVGVKVITVSHDVLVMGPLALTALSILMTLVSKRVTYPWIISLFTLLLPLVLLFTMTFGV